MLANRHVGRLGAHPRAKASMAVIALVVVACAGPVTLLSVPAAAADPAGVAQDGSVLSAAEQSIRRGRYVQAVDLLTDALTQITEGDWAGHVELLALRAEAYLALGYLRQAAADLEDAIALATANRAADTGRLRGSLGGVFAATGP